MKGQPNRLVFDGKAPFGGAEIDRSRPLQLRLNGTTISGFAGDSVLSAALATGIDTVGTFRGWPLALGESFAPAIVPTSASRGDLSAALPMAQTPATDGAAYRTLGPRKRRGLGETIERLQGPPRSLGLDLDTALGLERPWIGREPDETLECDVIVVGGGVAGMSAALAAAQNGQTVALLEASLALGGNARLFGTQDGEEHPDQTISRLRAEIVEQRAITVLLNAQVFATRRGRVRAHVVQTEASNVRGRILDIAAPHIVLATGAIEQLPVFPGNRLPGVVGAAEAFRLAYRFGIWPGRRAALATVSSPAYRLTMQAKDAGIEVVRVVDGRPDPQSRFIAFSKAYGITMAAGTVISAVQPGPKAKGLLVSTRLAHGIMVHEEPEIGVDRLAVCGGWQPELTLWHMAGGESRWDDPGTRLQPVGVIEGVALAGSVAGLVTRKACLASGEAAVARLLGHTIAHVADELIPAIHETPDGPAPVTERTEGQAPAYLGSGTSLLDRPMHAEPRVPSWVPFFGHDKGWELAETPHPLEVTDITAGVRLGAIPAASAGIVAQERVAMVALTANRTGVDSPAAPDDGVIPPYLAGRFGPSPTLWIIAAQDRRRLETGTLIFANSDDSDPSLAIGVVVRRGDGAALALLEGDHAPDVHVSLQEGSRTFTVRIVAPFQIGMALEAPLGGEPGAA